MYCIPLIQFAFKFYLLLNIVKYSSFIIFIISLCSVMMIFLISNISNLGILSFFSCLASLVIQLSVASDFLWPLQHARFSSPSPSPRAFSDSYLFSRWCHPNISSSVVPFSSCLQSFQESGSFPMSQLFTSGGQSTRASASASVLWVNIQDWFPLGLTGLISLQSNRLSRLFYNTTVQKHQFFSTQPPLWSNSHIHTWLLRKSH